MFSEHLSQVCPQLATCCAKLSLSPLLSVHRTDLSTLTHSVPFPALDMTELEYCYFGICDKCLHALVTVGDQSGGLHEPDCWPVTEGVFICVGIACLPSSSASGARCRHAAWQPGAPIAHRIAPFPVGAQHCGSACLMQLTAVCSCSPAPGSAGEVAVLSVSCRRNDW